MKCDICNRDVVVKPYLLTGGASLGDLCGSACFAIAWAQHLDGLSPNPDDIADTRWRHRRRIADAEGRQFAEPHPKSGAEKELNRVIDEKGWTREADEAEAQARTLNLEELLNAFAEIKRKEKS